MYMFIMEYCNLVVPKLRRNIFFGICILICGLVSTNEYHHLYYSSVSYTGEGMFPHLILNHGVLYNLYNVFIAYYFIVILWVAIRKLRQTKSPIIRKQLLMILTGFAKRMSEFGRKSTVTLIWERKQNFISLKSLL